MKANKVLAMTLAMAMTAGMLAGCGSSEKEVKETKKVEDSASEGEQITLNYWTWFPSKDQIQETVDAFEKENPDIKINMTVMESKAFQEKVSECLITFPFGVLMMKNFFDGLPTELMESANVDGASIQRCFFSIYLPLAKPAIINLAVLQIMWSFQDFLFPLMFLTKDKAYTTTVAVNAFKGAYGMTPQNLGRYNAALVLISIPSILIFTFAQKFIVNGITSGAVKE